MKKALFIVVSTLLSLSLVACASNDNNSPKSSASTSSHKDTVKVAATGKTYKTNSSFKNGVYKTKKYILTLTKEQIIKDKEQGETGLVVWFTVKNIGKDSNVTPSDSISNLTFKQSDGSSISELENDFDAEDAMYPGDSDSDIDKQNAMISIEHKVDSKIIPGKTAKSFAAYTLDNDKYNITVTASDPKTMQKVGSMTIKIKH